MSRRCLVLCLPLVAALMPSCASSSGSGDSDRPPVSEDAYAGPAVALDSTSGPNHLIRLSAPSPGWSFTFDQVGPAEGDVFVTVTGPNAEYMYPQVIVEQRLDSTVGASKPVRVFVRVLDFGAKPVTAPYRLAGQSAR
jgi:hypothetical protein